MKKYLSFFSVAAFSLAAIAMLVTVPANAADFMAPRGDDNEGRISTGREETYHNLYVAGADVSINGPTTGDLYAAGGWVSVEGPVEQDVTVAGGTVTINEPVNGDVRAAGGKIIINAPVAGDVLVGAGDLVLTDKASVGGELRAAGGSVVVNGPVAGGAYFMGERIVINSKIDGTVKVTATEQLVFGAKAEVASEVSYIGKKNAFVTEGAQVSVAFTELDKHERSQGKRTGILGFLLGGFIIKFFAVVLVGLVILRLFRGPLETATNRMLAKPWSSLGIGFVTAVVAPVAIIIALVLVVGYYIAILAGMVYILALLVSSVVSAIFLGAWIVKVLTKKPSLALDWQAIVIGVVVLMLLKFIPVVGWAICLALYLAAFGALISGFRNYVKHSGGKSGTHTHTEPSETVN